MQKTLLAIAGPTACGKTLLSIQLAKALKCEIISADSRQFYKEMSIGTAKPSADEMQGIPHHFIDFISVKEDYNVGKYEADVLSFLEKYFKQNNIAILVGGSGLYMDAVCTGMDKIPPSDEQVRTELTQELQGKGISFLLENLKFLDKKYYDVVDKKNPHRIIRALEVCVISGVPYSSFRKKEIYEQNHTKITKKRKFKVIKTGLEISREKLYEKINKRVDEMIEKGLVDEAKKLFPFRNMNALQTVGYKELFDFFENKISLEMAIGLIKQNTRRFAKRQMTWFRKDKEIAWFFPTEKEKIISFINKKAVSIF